MVGDYGGARVVVDKYAGTTASVMRFVAVNNIYVPITALKENLNDIAKKTSRSRVVAVFTKSIGDAHYIHISYRAHDVPLSSIADMKHLAGMVDFDNLIFPENWTTSCYPRMERPAGSCQFCQSLYVFTTPPAWWEIMEAHVSSLISTQARPHQSWGLSP